MIVFVRDSPPQKKTIYLAGECLVISIGMDATVARQPIDGTTLPFADLVKDLNWLLQNNLSISSNCMKVAAAGMKDLWMLLRSIKRPTVQNFSILFHTTI